jgi:hypothetical protein
MPDRGPHDAPASRGAPAAAERIILWTMAEPPILWGDGRHCDRAVIAHLLDGGVAYHMGRKEVITAPTLRHLPPGMYRVVPAE